MTRFNNHQCTPGRAHSAAWRSLLLATVLSIGCDRGAADEACRATSARLEALECEANMKDLLSRGCFEPDLEVADCDLSVLDPCTDEIGKLPKGPDGWPEPLDSFLDRKCGPEGTKTIEWPKADRAAIAAAQAEAAKAEAEAAAAALAAAEAAEREEAEAIAETGEGARVKVTKMEIQGALDRAEVTKVVGAKLAAVQKCYGAGLVKAPQLAGKVAINFVITGAGKVGSSVVQSSDLEDSSVANCMAKAIKRLTFASPRGGGNVIVTISFVLSSQ
jgi:hypothetical protein